jgi:uncharacterized protein (DUF362 family)
MATVVATALARRGRDNQGPGTGGKPLLVIVEGEDIDAMVDAGLEAIGGLGRVIGAHRQVVLKPNTNQRDPFPSITAPETIRAVARHCRAAGAEHILVHEDHRNELDLIYNPADLPRTEIQISHAPEAGHYVLVEHRAWHGDLDPDVGFPGMEGSPMLERLRKPGVRRTEGPRLRIARQLQEAPVIINLPVLKRHFAGQITSAIKNHFGSVYGLHRWLAHASLQDNRDYFDRKLAEFASAVRPELTITDVRSLQAVFGPSRSAETKIIDGVNRLIITGDMVAADVVAMRLMKQHDSTFTSANEAIVRRQHEHAEELGLGSSDLSQFEIIELKL